MQKINLGFPIKKICKNFFFFFLLKATNMYRVKKEYNFNVKNLNKYQGIIIFNYLSDQFIAMYLLD